MDWAAGEAEKTPSVTALAVTPPSGREALVVRESFKPYFCGALDL